MAVIANTFQTTSARGNRPDLDTVVSMITPSDTPIYSLVEKVKFTDTNPQWYVDDLAAPADNAQLEGDEYTFGATTAVTKVGNYTQIFRKDGIISGTQDAADNTASQEQVKRQKLKKGQELLKDVEFSIVSAFASVAGATRRSGSLSSWITSNVSRGATGANGGYNSGTGLTVAPTNGTQRAFTKALMDNVMQQGYQNGANFSHMVVSPYVKSVFVTFMSDTNVASFRYNADDGKGNRIIANADIYEGPFGKVFVVPNRVMAGAAGLARNAFFIDTNHLQFGWFRKMKEDKDVAKTGDAQKFVIIGEGALKPRNEKGLGVVADVFGLTAST